MPNNTASPRRLSRFSCHTLWVVVGLMMASPAAHSASSSASQTTTKSILGDFASDFFGCLTSVTFPVSISEVPVCDITVRKEVAKQTDILSNGRDGILEQQVQTNTLLMQINNAIGKPSITTLMLPAYIGTATVMMAGMSGLGDIAPGSTDINKSGTTKTYTDKNMIDFSDVSGALSTFSGGGDLKSTIGGFLGVDAGSLEGQIFNGLFDYFTTGSFNIGSLIDIAKQNCGADCDVTIGDQKINPLDIFSGDVHFKQFDINDFMYGGGVCNTFVPTTGNHVCKDVGILAGSAQNGDLIKDAVNILNKNIKKTTPDNNSERGTKLDEQMILYAASNFLPQEEKYWSDPVALKNVATTRESSFKSLTAVTVGLGQNILVDMPKIYNRLIKGNDAKGCTELFAKANKKLDENFNENSENNNLEYLKTKLKGDCINLKNLVTESKSLRGDVQAMIAVKYTDLLMSMAQLNMMSSTGAAQGQTATLNAPVAFVPKRESELLDE